MLKVKWSALREEALVIDAIAQRASRMASLAGLDYPVLMAAMDVTAVHLNICPLRLRELQHADNFNFAHDVFGIRRHLDREEMELKDCFVPRFALPNSLDVPQRRRA